MSPPADPVDAYLAAFARQLPCPLRRRRRILEATEGHLHDTTEALIAEGMSTTAAQREAIERYGSAAAAAASSGTSPVGVACRALSRLRR